MNELDVTTPFSQYSLLSIDSVFEKSFTEVDSDYMSNFLGWK